MRLEKTWTASSESDQPAAAKELVHLAAIWDVGIDVQLTNPYQVRRAPVQRTTLEGRQAERPED